MISRNTFLKLSISKSYSVQPGRRRSPSNPRYMGFFRIIVVPTPHCESFRVGMPWWTRCPLSAPDSALLVRLREERFIEKKKAALPLIKHERSLEKNHPLSMPGKAYTLISHRSANQFCTSLFRTQQTNVREKELLVVLNWQKLLLEFWVGTYSRSIILSVSDLYGLFVSHDELKIHTCMFRRRVCVT